MLCLVTDEDIKATLPSLDGDPPSFHACVELGAYDMFSVPAHERAAATYHSSQLLHIPGESVQIEMHNHAYLFALHRTGDVQVQTRGGAC